MSHADKVAARHSNSRLRCLWVHNFYPGNLVNGVFMHTLADVLNKCGVQVELFYAGQLSNPLEVWRSRRLLREIEGTFDIVHAQYGSMCSLVAIAGRKPRLMTLRGTDWYSITVGPWDQRLHCAAGNFLTRQNLKYYDRLVVMSHSMKAELEQYDGSNLRHCVDVVPDGIDLELFKPMDRQVCRQALGCGDDLRPWVLLTSAIDGNPIKRMSLAREAFELARLKLPDLVLKVANHIEHRHMPLWVNACNATLMTSIHEGWPNAIKESLACNIPFVSTDVSDLGLISAQEPSCKTVAPDPQALADALVDTLQNPLTSHLRRHVESMDALVIAWRLTQIYQEMLGEVCAV